MKTHRLITLIALGSFAFTAAPLVGASAKDEDTLLAVLASSDAGLEEKAMACDNLGRVGTAKAVPALAALLADEELNDYARDGLERIKDPAAGEALLAALEKLEGPLLVGVVITLGDRGEEAAAPALQKMATDTEHDAADAALSSLGLIATDEASETIIALLSDDDAKVRIAAAQAALVAAERRNDKNQSTAALLEAVREADVPAHVKNAAK